MSDTDLRKVDLNLLKAFDALDRERNVTAAAKRLAIGQPAMSHALARLRQLLDDQLFVRGPAGMVPTARAAELVEPIRSALAQIEQALSGQPAFDPLETTVRFRVGMSDLVAAAMVPKLMETLRQRAPKAQLSIRSTEPGNTTRMLDDREIDLAVGYYPKIAGWHMRQELFDEDFGCVFNPELIRVRRPITLKQFVAHPHILVTLSGDHTGFVDEALGKLQLTRNVLIACPYFLLTGYLLHKLPAIATLPRHFADVCASAANLAVSPLPFPAPKYKISMVWLRSSDKNPESTFLRSLIAQ